MRAQSNEKHYQVQLEKQQAAVAKATEVEHQYEVEYTVCYPFSLNIGLKVRVTCFNSDGGPK
jgi:hypothetical protein